jgi:hypothetical protein
MYNSTGIHGSPLRSKNFGKNRVKEWGYGFIKNVYVAVGADLAHGFVG